MKKLIGRAAVWLFGKLKPVIIWCAGFKRDPYSDDRYLVGGFSIHVESAVDAAEKRLKG